MTSQNRRSFFKTVIAAGAAVAVSGGGTLAGSALKLNNLQPSEGREPGRSIGLKTAGLGRANCCRYLNAGFTPGRACCPARYPYGACRPVHTGSDRWPARN